jgi:superfamily I DNA and/or RNA helicase
MTTTRPRCSRPSPGADHVRTLVELGTLPAWRPFLHGAAPGVLVVGATVWAASKLAATWRKAQEAPAAGPDASGDDGADPEAAEAAPLGPPVAPLFDVVLVDEASQMKVPEAILALTLLRPGGSVLLAGDDRQLPPIVHGTYPDEHAHLLTSIFAFMRHRAEARQAAGEAGAVARTLFPLTENFRMNEPLTAYPRAVLYGEYTSTRPGIRITLDGAGDDNALLAALLDPLRPVVLVRYAPPRAYTARNPLEADLAARLVAALGVRLVDPETGGVYLPDRLAAEGVACVAPHRAQNAAIRAALRGLGYGVEDEEGTIARPLPLVDTVDKLQGKERDVVVVSYGVADDEYAEAEAGFLLSRNRFNVAVTRARRKVIVLVADPVVDTVPADRRVLLDAMMLKEFGRYCDDGEEAIEIEAEGQTVTLRLRWKGFGEEGA